MKEKEEEEEDLQAKEWHGEYGRRRSQEEITKKGDRGWQGVTGGRNKGRNKGRNRQTGERRRRKEKHRRTGENRGEQRRIKKILEDSRRIKKEFKDSGEPKKELRRTRQDRKTKRWGDTWRRSGWDNFHWDWDPNCEWILPRVFFLGWWFLRAIYSVGFVLL